MTRLFLSIYDYLSQRKWLATLLLLAGIGLCIWLGARLNYKENITDFLPQNKENEKFTSVYEGLGDQGKITLIFRAADSTLTPEEGQERLMEAVDAFEAGWTGNDETDTLPVQLQCRAEESQAFDAIAYIQDNVALFLTDEDYHRIDSLLAQPGYIDTCMQSVRKMLAFPMSAIAVEAIGNDPLNLFSPTLQRLATLSASDAYQMVDGYVFDNEGHAFAFMTSPYSSADTRHNTRLAGLIDNVVQKAMEEVPGVQISAVGAPLIAVTNATQIKKDSFLSIALAFVFIMAILLFAMGHKRNILWLGFSIVAGWLFALGAIALFKPAISIIVVGIGSVLVGIAVNYPLHYLDHIRLHTNRREALKDMIAPLATGNITTVSAFACLVFVNAEAMHDLGLFGSLMLVGTILFVLVFLPLYAKPGRHGRNPIAQSEQPQPMRSTSPTWKRLSPYVLVLVILLTVVLGYFSTQTSFDSDLHNINYMTAQQEEDLELLSRSLGDESQESLLYVVSEGSTLDEALAASEQILRDTAASLRHYALSGIAGVLPSQSQQQHSLERWNQFIASHPNLGKEVTAAAKRQGFVPQAFAAFTQHLEKSYSVQSTEEMEALLSLCKNYILSTDGNVQVVNFVHAPVQQAEAAKATFRKQHDGDTRNFIFDITDVGSNLVSALSNDFNYILYVCSFVVFFFLWLSFGRLELALLAFIPLTVGWLWILGMMELAAVKFNIVNIILATFIFGQGDDYTIFITEGLMYEYTYGKQRLKSYQRSVVISAALMFVGIGVLIFAKHPAMRSLAQVAIIGMATVILMACYLPPLIYRWLTTKKGKLRRVPVTLKRLLYTFLSLLVFFIAAFFIYTPFTFIYRLIGRDTEEKRLRFHGFICTFCQLAIRLLPDVGYEVRNLTGETFDKPAVIVCNHQSHLDLVCMLMLTPKMVILTNDWVWRDPIYGAIIRYAEFYPVSNGYENNLPRLKNLVERGYSVMIFPEGTRTMDGTIGRFHKGAFLLAQQLGVDILPLFLHGADHVMPKTDIILRKGFITTEICARIPAAEIQGRDTLELTSEMRRYYLQHFSELRHELENEQYFLPLVRYQYMYKGRDVERRCRKALRGWVKGATPETLGQGEIPLLTALAHPENEYHYEFDNEDDYLIASNCAVLPANLHYSLKGGLA